MLQGIKRKSSPTATEGCFEQGDNQAQTDCSDCPYVEPGHGQPPRLYCSGICTTIRSNDELAVSLCNRWTEPTVKNPNFLCHDHIEQKGFQVIEMVLDPTTSKVKYTYHGHEMKVREDRVGSRRFISPVLDYLDAAILNGHGLLPWWKKPNGRYVTGGRTLLTSEAIETGLKSKLDYGVSLNTIHYETGYIEYEFDYTLNSLSSFTLQKLANSKSGGDVLDYLNNHCSFHQTYQLGPWESEVYMPGHNKSDTTKYYVEGPITTDAEQDKTFDYFTAHIQFIGEESKLIKSSERNHHKHPDTIRYCFLQTTPGLTLAERASFHFADFTNDPPGPPGGVPGPPSRPAGVPGPLAGVPAD